MGGGPTNGGQENKRGARKGFMVNMICKLLKQTRDIWIHRNSYQRGMTTEGRQAKKRASVGPRVGAAYRRRHTDSTLVHQRLFRLDLGKRLIFSPEENERWLEVVETVIKFKRVREEVVLAATWCMTDVYPIHRERHSNDKSEANVITSEGKDTVWRQRSLKKLTYPAP